MKEKTLKDVIENHRRNWYSESDESQDDNCYKGLFWDHTTKTYKRWKELQRANEEENTSTNST